MHELATRTKISIGCYHGARNSIAKCISLNLFQIQCSLRNTRTIFAIPSAQRCVSGQDFTSTACTSFSTGIAFNSISWYDDSRYCKQIEIIWNLSRYFDTSWILHKNSTSRWFEMTQIFSLWEFTAVYIDGFSSFFCWK